MTDKKTACIVIFGIATCPYFRKVESTCDAKIASRERAICIRTVDEIRLDDERLATLLQDIASSCAKRSEPEKCAVTIVKVPMPDLTTFRRVTSIVFSKMPPPNGRRITSPCAHAVFTDGDATSFFDSADICSFIGGSTGGSRER